MEWEAFALQWDIIGLCVCVYVLLKVLFAFIFDIIIIKLISLLL